jgi:hypothetical protein
VADLSSWTWPVGTFDAAIAIFAHFRPDDRPAIHRNMLRALRPGGLVLIEAYNPYQHIYRTGGPPFLEMLYSAYMLQQDFADAEIELVEETLSDIREGQGHRGMAATTRLVARRKLPT